MAKRGPKPTFERVAANKEGAPLLAVRLEPRVYTHIKGRPEGARAYIERLVTDDAQLSEQGTSRPLVGESSAELPLSGEAEQAAEA